MFEPIQWYHLNVCFIESTFELMKKYASIIFDPFTDLVNTFEKWNITLVLW